MKTTLAEALDARGYTELTAVQEAVTAPELAGRDMLVSAQTGSGKTLGFGLAIAPTLLGEGDRFDRADAPLALVIAPTRELAMQVKRELSWLYEKAGAVLASTVGGMDIRDERRALARGAHIVVATPGRLRDHIMRDTIDLSQIRAVVLDEADEMLDLGFREDLEYILDTAPAERQTLLFSATVPPAIARLAQSYQRDAERIATASKTEQHADIDYQALRVGGRDTENAIINVLRFYEAPNAIVFCNTRAAVARLTSRLSNRGFSVVALSGELTQNERSHALQAMRDGRARVCVATDVAARGIDLPNLDLVVHADLPSNQEALLHRSGRTGRAGRKGVSAMILPPNMRKKGERLLGWAKLTATWVDAPGVEEVLARDEERMLAHPDWQEPVGEAERGLVNRLIDAFTPEQLAAAYLRQFRQKHSAPEELAPIADVQRKPREAFGPGMWFSLEGGRSVDAEPRRVLPMLCKLGNVSRDDIGAIRIQPDASLFELRLDAVPGFLDAIGPAMEMEGAALIQLDKPPVFDKGPRKPGGPRKPHRKGDSPGHGDVPRRPVGAKRAGKPDRPARVAPPEVHKEAKPKGKRPDAPKSKRPESSKSSKPEGFKGKPKGPKPPVGKPNSKKNRARRAAGAGGGTGYPTRKSSSAKKG